MECSLYPLACGRFITSASRMVYENSLLSETARNEHTVSPEQRSYQWKKSSRDIQYVCDTPSSFTCHQAHLFVKSKEVIKHPY